MRFADNSIPENDFFMIHWLIIDHLSSRTTQNIELIEKSWNAMIFSAISMKSRHLMFWYTVFFDSDR